MKRLLFLILWLCLSSSTVFALDMPSGAKQGIGFGGGFVTGTGITYRYYFDSSFVQGAFFARYSASDSENYFNGAISYGRYLHYIELTKALPPVALAFITGVNAVYNSQGDFDEEVNPDPARVAGRLDKYKSNLGAGLSIEIGNPRSPGLDLWLAITYAGSFSGVLEKLDVIEPLPSIGILYNW